MYSSKPYLKYKLLSSLSYTWYNFIFWYLCVISHESWGLTCSGNTCHRSYTWRFCLPHHAALWMMIDLHQNDTWGSSLILDFSQEFQEMHLQDNLKAKAKFRQFSKWMLCFKKAFRKVCTFCTLNTKRLTWGFAVFKTVSWNDDIM